MGGLRGRAPSDKPIIVLRRHPKTGRILFDIRWPNRVLREATSRENVLKYLDYYSKSFNLKQFFGDPLTRRYYVEQIRPALRYFCRKFNVEIPAWLEGNYIFEQYDPEEFKEMYGSNVPLGVREFPDREHDS